VAEHRGVLYGLWGPAQYQGRIAGQNAAGRALEFGGVPSAHTLKVLNAGVFSLGQIAPDGAACAVVEGESAAGYACFLFRGAQLAGAILFGDVRAAVGVKKAAESRADLSALLSAKPSTEELAAYFAEHT